MIAVARREAEQLGRPDRAPPRLLEECDRGQIESALHAPAVRLAGMERDAYHDLPAKAAVLTYALAKSQACIDGNKRIALLLLVEFLSINGATLNATNDGVASMILDTAASNASERDHTLLDLTLWFEDHIKPWEA